MRDLYIANWGAGFFQVDSQGFLTVQCSSQSKPIRLHDIAQSAISNGLNFPFLIRFTDILQHCLYNIYNSFKRTCHSLSYQADYTLVYPIKVNQSAFVVNGLIKSKQIEHFGLEAGSKAELLAIIGVMPIQSMIICNGYKDIFYIRAALIAQKMGHTVFLVIENLSELDIILSESTHLQIRPQLGVRLRLNYQAKGKWQDTGGIQSKFGLNSIQLIALINSLKSHSRLDCLTMMHCHLGSQISNLNCIRSALYEITQYYAELHQLGIPLNYVDLGGGLAIDYQGNASQESCSMNYSIDHYAEQIVSAFISVCKQYHLPHPHLITESGRAITAHHAVLITNIFDIDDITHHTLSPSFIQPHDFTSQLLNIQENLGLYSFSHSFQQASTIFQTCQNHFNQGHLSLADKAQIEYVYFKILTDLKNLISEYDSLYGYLRQQLAIKIYCNLSFFHSLPDAWAIQQVFPIVPLSHLHQEFEMESILYDLSCDSDGKIKCYAGPAETSQTLLLPKYDQKYPYYLGFFLLGAYQEILGNRHNLFSNTSVIDIKLHESGHFDLTIGQCHATISEVLAELKYNNLELIENYQQLLHQQILNPTEVDFYLRELKDLLMQSTYLAIRD